MNKEVSKKVDEQFKEIEEIFKRSDSWTDVFLQMADLIENKFTAESIGMS